MWTIVIAGLALVLSSSALCVALLSARRVRPSANDADVATLRSELRRLDSDIDDVFDRMKRLTSRKGMQARRDEVKSGAQLPGETADAWKLRMRKARQNGAHQFNAPEEV